MSAWLGRTEDSRGKQNRRRSAQRDVGDGGMTGHARLWQGQSDSPRGSGIVRTPSVPSAPLLSTQFSIHPSLLSTQVSIDNAGPIPLVSDLDGTEGGLATDAFPLYPVISQIAATFAGFGSLASGLGQRRGGDDSRMDAYGCNPCSSPACRRPCSGCSRRLLGR